MKTKFTLLLMFGALIHSEFSAQTVSNCYALTRELPAEGGALSLVEYNLMNSTETIIKTYSETEILDFNPEATTFDAQNGYLITVGEFSTGDSLIAINILNGSIEYSLHSEFEIFCIESFESKIYSLVRPIVGGNLSFIEFDIFAQTENVINTYTPQELLDFNPETITIDIENQLFITMGDFGANDSIMGIDFQTGAIEYTMFSDKEVFSLEYYDSKIYSMVRPIAGGDLMLVEYDLVNTAELEIKNYSPAELLDFNPEATTMDPLNGYLVTVGDFGTVDSLVAIDIHTGTIDYSCFSANQEIFALEMKFSSELSTNEVKNYIITAYPNPTNGLINISLHNNSDKYEQLIIRDILGNIVLEFPLNSIGLHHVDLTDFSNGVYYFSINGTTNLETVLIIKE